MLPPLRSRNQLPSPWALSRRGCDLPAYPFETLHHYQNLIFRKRMGRGFNSPIPPQPGSIGQVAFEIFNRRVHELMEVNGYV